MNRVPKQTRLAVLLLFPMLCVLLPSAATTDTVANAESSRLTFTLETKEKTVEFYEPLSIRVVLRNNSRSSLFLNTKSLRLIPYGWHVVGTNGEWMEGEGLPLEPEDPVAERMQLAAGASVRLLTVHDDPSFELLGPVRVAYKLSSTDP